MRGIGTGTKPQYVLDALGDIWYWLHCTVIVTEPVAKRCMNPVFGWIWTFEGSDENHQGLGHPPQVVPPLVEHSAVAVPVAPGELPKAPGPDEGGPVMRMALPEGGVGVGPLGGGPDGGGPLVDGGSVSSGSFGS